MNIENNQQVSAASSPVRDGWDKEIQSMAVNGDDEMLMIDTGSSEFDDKEWQW